jgi:hypothetical protein
MPINSYLAYPVRGRRDALAEALRTVAGCQVIPALNRDVLVVVTATADDAAEAALREALAGLELLQGLALVAAIADPDAGPGPAPETRA